jgi:hypothetical protein
MLIIFFDIKRIVHKQFILADLTVKRQCGILNISQPYRPPRRVTGITLLYTSIFLFFFPHRENFTSSWVMERFQDAAHVDECLIISVTNMHCAVDRG